MKADGIIRINRGDVIHSGQGQPESKVFRIVNMGMLFTQDSGGFLAAFQKVLETATVRA